MTWTFLKILFGAIYSPEFACNLDHNRVGWLVMLLFFFYRFACLSGLSLMRLFLFLFCGVRLGEIIIMANMPLEYRLKHLTWAGY